MITFAYSGYGQDGRVTSGLVEAIDAGDALLRLDAHKIRAFALSPAKAAPSSGKKTVRRSKGLRIEAFLGELSPLLNAGFNSDAAVRIIASAEMRPSLKAELTDLHESMVSGMPLSSALAQMPALPAEIAPMIASGETSGKLPEVVARLAESLKARAVRRAALVESLIYPGFLVAMMIAAFFFLALFLVPAIEPVFESGNVERPLVVRVLGAVNHALTEHGPRAWAIVGLLALALFYLFVRRSHAKDRLIGIAARLPLIGSMLKQGAAARYMNTLGLLLGNGVRMTEALRLAAATCGDPGFRRELEAAAQTVTQGQGLQAALQSTRLFDPATLSLIRIGEESNRLAQLLTRAAELKENQLQRRIDRLLTFLTPAITLTLGLLIGMLVVSVMSALLAMNEVAIQ